MSVSLSQASIPVFERMLGNLRAILAKGEAFAVARKFDPAILVQARLAPDMHPLARQVQIATDVVKGGAARLSGMEVPSFPDTETSFAELNARIEKVLAFIRTADTARIDASADRDITLKVGDRTMTFAGSDYVFGFVVPNMYFHITTTYAILRHQGVELGKMDFIGKI